MKKGLFGEVASLLGLKFVVGEGAGDGWGHGNTEELAGSGRAAQMGRWLAAAGGPPGQLAWIIHDLSAAAHQPQNPFISLLDDALHRLRGLILGF